MKRNSSVLKIILVLASVLLAAILLTACGNQIVLKGEVEAPVYSQYTEVSGKITKLPVELGQSVKAGDLIAEIDDTDAKYALEQLQAVLAKKKAVLAKLEEGADSLEIKQAKNNIDIAKAGYDSKKTLADRALSDYENALSLYNEGAITQNDMDNALDRKVLAEQTLISAETTLDNAKQSLNLLLEGADKQDITAAQADVDQTESQVRQLEDNLAKYRITAVADGVVISKNYLLGDNVSVGYNLMDISAQNEKYLVTYVPKDDIYNVEYGQSLTINYGNEAIQGTVTFIDNKTQYTPKDLQTSVNKNKDSIKIKILLPEDSTIKPGEEAEVVIKKVK